MPVLCRALSAGYKRAFKAYWRALTEPFGGVAEGAELRLLIGRVCALGAEFERASEELAVAQGLRETELQLWLKNVDRSSLATGREKVLKAYLAVVDADYQTQVKAHRSVLVEKYGNKK
jgi:hypothetical protein